MKRAIVLSLVATMILTGCRASAQPAWTYAPATASPAHAALAGAAASPAPSTAPVSAAPVSGAGSTIKIEAFDLGFTPSMLSVAGPGTYPVEFHNTGSTLHDVTFADGTKIAAEGGQTAIGTVTVPTGGITFMCSIPGHAQAGMKGEIMVGDAMQGMSEASSVPAASDTAGSTAAAPVEDPNAPPYVLRDPVAPAVMSGTVHDVTMPIVDRDITVAKGFVVHAWTFGGTVPGPTLRVHIGDTVRVHLVNQSSMSHSIDFHASQTAMNDQMVEIKPGASFTYAFRADYAGVWMYHCGTAPALHHIANGMFGMVIVEPKGGLPKVDQEVALVQSEWYLGAQKEPADYAKANAAAPAPDFVVFNGIANQYKDNPIAVTTKGAGASVRPQCRAEPRQLLPHGRHDLRLGRQGGHRPREGQCRRLGQPGGRSRACPGGDHRVQPSGGRDVSLRHPRLQLRRPGRDRDLHGG